MIWKKSHMEEALIWLAGCSSVLLYLWKSVNLLREERLFLPFFFQTTELEPPFGGFSIYCKHKHMLHRALNGKNSVIKECCFGVIASIVHKLCVDAWKGVNFFVLSACFFGARAPFSIDYRNDQEAMTSQNYNFVWFYRW